MKYIKIACVLLCSLFGFSQGMLGCEGCVVPCDVIKEVSLAYSGNCDKVRRQIELITKEKEDEVMVCFQTRNSDYPLTKADAHKILQQSNKDVEVNYLWCTLSHAKLTKFGIQRFTVRKEQVSVLEKYMRQSAPVQAQVHQQEKF